MKAELKKIIQEFASQYKLDWRILYAILMNESNAEGFWKDGGIKKRFEQHIFNSLKRNKLYNLDKVWIASHTDDEKYLMATSFGIAQIMGWQYPLLNYNTITDLVQTWTDSEEIQVRDFCLFCVRYNNGKFLQALKNKDLDAIAIQYNGIGHSKNNYIPKLKKNIELAK